jgi:protein gp37
MSDNSSIEWTDTTWNPTTGCNRVSPGCDHCYAMTLAKRLKAMGSAKYQTDGDPRTSGPGFGVAVHPDSLDAPLHWRKPRRVFVNSMSDLFHDKVPTEFIAQVFAVMALAPQHTFQVLTKRHARMRSVLSNDLFFELVGDEVEKRATDDWRVQWPLPNVWIGVSVETQQWADIRVPALLGTPAAVRFLSCEPLLGPIDLHFCGGVDALWPDWSGGPGGGTGAPHPIVDWVIAGGESGDDARPVDAGWIRWIRDQCDEAEVPFLFKQWGGRTPKAGGRELDGRTWDEYPAVAS